MTQDDRMETITAETDNPTVCITHGRFIPCRNEDWHHFTDNPYWVKSVRDFQGSDDPNLTWEPATLTITDPAAIRATDEPDERGERGDFPCCTDRTHKESLGGDSESGTYNRSNRPPAGPCTDERTTPAPSSGAGPDLGALHETICDNFTGMAEVQQAADLLVAEVRRLTGVRAECERQFQAQVGLVAAETTRAESAEAEVVTLRARLAAVEALTVDWPCSDDTCDGDCTGCAYASDLRAALAVTTGEGE